VGILANSILLFRSLASVVISQANFGVPSLHPKIPFPARDGAAGPVPFGGPGKIAVLGTKNAV
jgi:hypothetical protein